MKLTPVEYAPAIPELDRQLTGPGLLLVVPDTRRPANVMTIGWALFGHVWGRPICSVLVRPSRYTFDLIKRAGIFTVNMMPEASRKAIARCGAVSGRDVDKIAEQGWTIAPGETMAAPYLVEAALHIECRTVLTSQVTPELDGELLAACYPKGDLHTIHFGLVSGIYRHQASQ